MATLLPEGSMELIVGIAVVLGNENVFSMSLLFMHNGWMNDKCQSHRVPGGHQPLPHHFQVFMSIHGNMAMYGPLTNTLVAVSSRWNGWPPSYCI